MCVSVFLVMVFGFVFFFKQKTAYEMRISDWSSDVCSSDLQFGAHVTLVNRTDVILRGYDEQIRDRLLQISMTKGIEFKFHVAFEKVDKQPDGSLLVHM